MSAQHPTVGDGLHSTGTIATSDRRLLRNLHNTFRRPLAMLAVAFVLSTFFVVLPAQPRAEAATTPALVHAYNGQYDFAASGATLRTSQCGVTTAPTTATISGIPADAVVTDAFLYWAGSYNSNLGGAPGGTPDGDVTFGPQGGTQAVAGTVDTDLLSAFGVDFEWFGAVADVTGLIPTDPNTTYAFDDLTVDTGNPHCLRGGVLAGWSMVIVYEARSNPSKVINIYEGFEGSRFETLSYTVDGFRVPAGAIDAEVALLTWEGDANLSGGEEVVFDGTTIATDSFNSVSNLITPPNSAGVDFDAYDVSGELTAGQTSATLEVSSGSDLVLFQMFLVEMPTEIVDILVSKVVDDPYPSIGDTITYTVTVSNTGPDPASGLVIRDRLRDGLSFVGATASAGSYNTNNGNWTIGDLAKDETVTLELQALVEDTGVTLNVARLRRVDQVESDATNNRDTVDIAVATLDVTKEVTSPLPAGAGDTVGYRITVTNPATFAQDAVLVTDTASAGATYLDDSTVAEGFTRSAAPVTTTYEVVSGAAIDATTSCATPLVAAIDVPDDIVIAGVDFGFTATHPWRGDIEVVLTSPGGTGSVVMLRNSADGNDDYDVLLSDGGGPLNSGTNDDPSAPFYDRAAAPSNPLDAFLGESALGEWEIAVCDSFVAADDGVFERAQLTIAGDDQVFTPVTKTNADATLDDGTLPNLVALADGFSLPAFGSMTIDYEVVIDDVLDGSITEIANGVEVITEAVDPPVEDSIVIELDFRPVLDVVKAGPAEAEVGETVTYTYQVSHDAASDMSPVTFASFVDDETTLPVFDGASDANGDGILEAGEIWTYSVTHVVGSTPDPLVNTATFTGTDGNGDAVEADDQHSLDVLHTPVAVDDAYSTDRDVPLSIAAPGVLGNDTDLDPGDTLTVDSSDTVSTEGGTVAVAADGSFDYTPAPGFVGLDTFTYTVCDQTGRCDTATVEVDVLAVNDPPDAVDDDVTTPEDTAVTIDAASNDVDPNGNLDPATTTLLTGPSDGSLVNNGDGTLLYTPNLDFNGTDSFTYEICDTGLDGLAGTGDELCDTATVTITVDPVNDPPVATDDAATTDEDTPVDIPVLVNDSDVDGDTLTVDSVTQPANGTVVVNNDGTVTYTPNADFDGTDMFTYTACDPGGLCDTATVTVTVNAVNDGPVALDDTATTDEDTPVDIDVLDNDSDVDGDTLTIDSLTQPANGSAVLDDGGTPGDPTDDVVTYTPDPNFNGTDTFTYTVCDPDGLCDTATVTVDVAMGADVPVAVDDTATTNEDTPVDVDVLVNDSDLDGDVLTIDSVTQPTNGSAVIDDGGTPGDPTDDVVTYTPDPDFNGTDTFTYTVCDPGGLCDTATVTVTVGAVNDAPVAEDDAETTDEEVPVDVDVLVNDSDVDGDTLTIDSVTQPANGSVVIDDGGTPGDPTDDVVTYTPDPDFNGTDTFTYTVCDPGGLCDTATVTITVNSVNDAPVAVDDTATTDEDTPVDIDVLDNDSDVDGDTLVVDSVTQPANGTVVVNTDGTVTYTPDPDFNGTDTFTYTVCDPDGLCDTATVTVTVGAVNDAPVAEDDAETTDEEVPVDVDVLVNDSDVDGDTLTIDSVTQPANGSVVVNNDGTVTYTPDADFNGTDTFTYDVCDPGGLCDTATVTITVNSINDAPVAVDDTATTDEDTPVDIDVLDNDSDVDGDTLVVDSVTQPANGTVVVNTDGTVTYTPDPDFNGTDMFTYTVCDPDGLCDTATVTVTVGAVNDAPVAEDDAETTDEEVPVDVDVLVNDSDVDGDVLTVDSVTQPANGTVVIDDGGTPGDPTDDVVTYTPNPDFNGTDTFTYDVCDPGGLCDTATVTITVNSINDAPEAANDAATTDEDTPVDIPVLDNDSDVDGDVLTVDSVTQPANGAVVVNTDGTVTYTPDPDFNGTDTFTYDACDPDGLCDTATVDVTVDAVNDPPVALDDADSTEQGFAVTVDVLANDSDVDDGIDSGSVSVTADPADGSVAVEADGSITYTPDVGFVGIDTFEYEVCDLAGACDTATVTVTVNDNGAPTPVDDADTTPEDTPINVDVLANDSDPDGDPLTLDSVTQPANGTVVIETDGTVTYTPDPDFNGTDTFTYSVCDDGVPQNCSTATVTVTVGAVNDAPVAEDDAETTDEEVPVDVDVLVNDSDVDGDVLTVDAVTQPANGTVVIDDGGTPGDPTDDVVTYTPNPDFNGTDTFTYDVCDPGGLCDTATVTITVNSINDAPVAVDDTATTDEDTPVDIPVLVNDSDVDGDTLVVDSVTQPANGAVVVNTDGTVTYTPDPDFNGTDMFTYTVCDPDGLCDTATVTVTVGAVNDAPVAEDDAETTDEEVPVDVDVLVNDSDVDGDVLTVDAVTQPANGTVVIDDGGTPGDPTDDVVTYTPNPDFNGTDTFTYDVCDPGGLCDTATVTITVNSINDAPEAANDAATTDEDTPVDIPVLDNDSDVDGDVLTVDSVTQPANGAVVVNTDGTVTYTPDPDFNGTEFFFYTVCDPDGLCDTARVRVVVGPVNDAPVAEDDAETTDEEVPVDVDVLVNDSDVDGDVLTVDAVTQPANGTVVNNNDGTVTYTPNPDFNGTDTFTYDVCDPGGLCDTATVTITVNSINDAPVAVDDTATTDEDTPVDIPVLVNDSDVDGDTLVVDSVTQPANGAVVVNTDGTVTYTPDPDFNGTDMFTYTVCDPDGLCDTATVDVTVDAVNDPPVALDDADSTDEDTPVDIPVLVNDSDVDGDVLTVDSVTQPANGTVTINTDGTVTYTPNPDFNGTDTFVYAVCDPDGLCDSAIVTVTVNAVNDAPVADDDAATTDEDTPVTIPVLDNDSDVDGDPLTVDSVTQSANGTVVIETDGTVTYTPDPDFNGTDTFTYSVCDPGGLCDTATVTVQVEPIADAPVAEDDAATTAEDTDVTIPVLDNDSDADGDPLTLDSVTQPANGTVTINDDGTVTYTPDPDFNGTDTFTYAVCDPSGLCDTATVTVDVEPVNDAPVAEDDVEAGDPGAPITVDVLDNDSDVDGDPLVVDSVTQPANGTVVINDDGTVTYTPDPGFEGPDTFTYTVCDPDGLCDTATVTVVAGPLGSITGIVWMDLNEDGTEDSADETQIPGVRLVLTWAGPDGVIGTPDDVVVGEAFTASPYEFLSLVPGTYQVSLDATTLPPGLRQVYELDGSLNETAVLTVAAGQSVVAVDFGYVYQLPVAADDEAVTVESTAVVIDVLANDTAVDGVAVTITAVSQPGHGQAYLNADGTITYLPDDGFTGVDTFTYEVTDANGNVVTATVTVVVTAQAETEDPDESLPFTGLEADRMAVIGAVLTLLGGALVLSSRRRRRI